MKFYCDECRDFVDIYLSTPIPTTNKVKVMYTIFCDGDSESEFHHYIARVDSDTADIIQDVLLEATPNDR